MLSHCYRCTLLNTFSERRNVSPFSLTFPGGPSVPPCLRAGGGALTRMSTSPQASWDTWFQGADVTGPHVIPLGHLSKFSKKADPPNAITNTQRLALLGYPARNLAHSHQPTNKEVSSQPAAVVSAFPESLFCASFCLSHPGALASGVCSEPRGCWSWGSPASAAKEAQTSSRDVLSGMCRPLLPPGLPRQPFPPAVSAGRCSIYCPTECPWVNGADSGSSCILCFLPTRGVSGFLPGASGLVRVEPNQPTSSPSWYSGANFWRHTPTC